MKRRAAVIFVTLVMMLMSAATCFAGDGELKIKSQYPEDGATGTSVENLSIKIRFDQDVYPASEKVRKNNEEAITMKSEDGKKVPIKVVYSEDEEGLMMVLSTNKAKIEGDKEYTLKIDKSFEATNGDKLSEVDKVTFKTQNQKRTMTVNMLLMFVMMGGMVVFSMKSTQHDAKKAKEEKGKHDTVNPYKEAKRTGKSVEEIVAKDQKQKEKEAAAQAKRDAKRAKEKEEERREELNIHHVAGPRPISAAGGKYKVAKKAAPEKSNKGTTRPKNQSGKQKNKGKK
ncbi:MAG: Ig-like domain-containing protein [Firmicutes bacterium]|nr:Ig-like domain-containing protein [Bacillota bacterium]